MTARRSDGSAGDANYESIGTGYTRYRQPDPFIGAFIHSALGNSRRILNVGAGAGSYEPLNREVVAIEPSASMRAQRPPHLPAAVDAVAEHLPFPDRHFDAAMATFTIHQWSDLEAGLRELRRVTSGPIVLLTCDPDEVERFWLNGYAPLVLATEARRYPALRRIRASLGRASVLTVPIPLHCADGFNEAYYGRPEHLLDAGARQACSAWSFVEAAASESYVTHLRSDLADGSWDRKFGHLRSQAHYDGSLRLVVAQR